MPATPATDGRNVLKPETTSTAVVEAATEATAVEHPAMTHNLGGKIWPPMSEGTRDGGQEEEEEENGRKGDALPDTTTVGRDPKFLNSAQVVRMVTPFAQQAVVSFGSKP